MAKFQKVVPEDIAKKQVEALLDQKIILPGRRAKLEMAIEAVVEGVMLGVVIIHPDGAITQKLFVSVEGVDGGELKYAAHVPAEVIARELQSLKTYNQLAVSTAYISMYTGQPTAVINRLEPADRNIADSIAFFCQ